MNETIPALDLDTLALVLLLTKDFLEHYGRWPTPTELRQLILRPS